MNERQGPTPGPYDPTRFTAANGPISPGPSGQLPPYWQPIPPSPPPHGNRRLISLLLGLVCVLTVTAVVLVVALVGRDRHAITQSSTTSRSSVAPSSIAPADRAPVPVAALNGFLPDRGVVSSAVADPAIDLVDHGDYIDADEIVDGECQGVFAVASRDYAGSGWTAIRSQRWNSPAEPNPRNPMNQVLLSVATYPQADAARAFYTKQSEAWSKCSGHIVNTRLIGATGSADQFWGVGRVIDSDGVLAAAVLDKSSDGWLCQNRLTARNNVAVRVEACGFGDSATAAQTILASITQKIDAAA